MATRLLLPLTIALVLAAVPTPGNQPPAPTSPSPGSVAQFIADEEGRGRQDREPSPADPFPELPDLSRLKALDPTTQRAAEEAFRAYYRYRQSGYEHRQRVFDWQLVSSKIIFWTVIVMVSAGIYFSGVQFHVALRGLRPRSTAAAPPDKAVATGEPGGAERTAERTGAVDAGTVTLQTSLEAGTGGIKLSSPVLGVIILMISFLFFYMYLIHIYPIREIQ